MLLPEYGWTIHRPADLTLAEEDQRDGAIIGAAVSALIISLLLYLVQRHRAYLANQPLAAIRTFMASTRIFAHHGDLKQVMGNLDLIAGPAERVAAVTANLKTFARKSEPGRPEAIQIDRALEGALFLVESHIKLAGVRIERDIQRGLLVTGAAVQLEQVVVNLVRNALDALEGSSAPCIGLTSPVVSMSQSDQRVLANHGNAFSL